MSNDQTPLASQKYKDAALALLKQQIRAITYAIVKHINCELLVHFFCRTFARCWASGCKDQVVEAVLNVLAVLSYFDFKHSVHYIEVVLETDYYCKVLASALGQNDKFEKLDQHLID